MHIVTFEWIPSTKRKIHNKERPVKWYKQSVKFTAIVKYAYHCTGHHALQEKKCNVWCPTNGHTHSNKTHSRSFVQVCMPCYSNGHHTYILATQYHRLNQNDISGQREVIPEFYLGRCQASDMRPIECISPLMRGAHQNVMHI